MELLELMKLEAGDILVSLVDRPHGAKVKKGELVEVSSVETTRYLTFRVRNENGVFQFSAPLSLESFRLATDDDLRNQWKGKFENKFITLDSRPSLILFVKDFEKAVAIGGWIDGSGNSRKREMLHPRNSAWSFRSRPENWRESTKEEIESLFKYILSE